MKTYTNPQMLSLEELHEAHLEMANSYLDSKWDASYYKLEPAQYEYDDHENYEVIQKYNRPYYRKQFSKVVKLMKEAGDKPWCEALSDDSGLLELLANDYGEYPVNISNIPLQGCSCEICTIDTTGQIISFPQEILLTKDEYLKLLVIVMDHRHVTFNNLYEYDMELFKSISGILNPEARDYSERNKKQSYTLVFDEIEEDVYNLLGEEDEHVDLYNESSETVYDVTIQFSEKRMAVCKMKINFGVEPEALARIWHIIYNVDAEAVLRVLNVNSYHDASIILKNRYHGFDSFDQVREFLLSNNIKYEYLKLID